MSFFYFVSMVSNSSYQESAMAAASTPAATAAPEESPNQNQRGQKVSLSHISACSPFNASIPAEVDEDLAGVEEKPHSRRRALTLVFSPYYRRILTIAVAVRIPTKATS